MASRRGDLPTDLGPFAPWIDPFRLSLQVAERSERTMEIYTDAASWFAGCCATPNAERQGA
ncbi:hypothetical protein [Micromonospora sp. WMMD812]|uniref:hypothetical protein n=1 Tax=Micromonospora sp. WMMD812 TaxID=3015152 RepID=UPI00248BD138|nr:hypothetical protein [Micromonospora sp. WMMD812]WBB67076.1 hypothetical protein O7603_28835 [Micromonospora sp. WMMD812]